MSNQMRCSRCNDWIDGDEEHDFPHLEERKVAALERIADLLEKRDPDEYRNWRDHVMVGLAAGTSGFSFPGTFVEPLEPEKP